MVADLMGDDIGQGEVAGRAEALRQLVEEGRVEIDLLVGRAVEGAHRRLRRAAAATWRAAAVGDQRRRLVLRARLAENVAPDLLGRAEHPQQEGRWCWRRASTGAGLPPPPVMPPPPPPPAERGQRAIAEQQDEDADDPEAAARPGRAAAERRRRRRRSRRRSAGPVLEIAAFRFAAEPHRLLSFCRLQCFDARNGCNCRMAPAKAAPSEKEIRNVPRARSRSSPARPRASASPSPARSPARAPRSCSTASAIRPRSRTSARECCRRQALHDGADLTDPAAIEAMIGAARRRARRARHPGQQCRHPACRAGRPVPAREMGRDHRAQPVGAPSTPSAWRCPAMKAKGWGRIINTACAHSLVA